MSWSAPVIKRETENQKESPLRSSDRQVRVLFIHTSGIEKTGSAPTHAKELCRGFQKAGARVTLFAPLHSPTRPKDLPCPVILIPMLFRHPLMAVLARLAVLAYLPWVLIKVRPHLIYERATFVGFIIHFVAHLVGIRLATELNGVVGEEWRDHGLPGWACWIADAICIAKFKHSVRVISVSEDIVNHYLAKCNAPREKFRAFHNGANVDHIRPMDKAACRRELGLPSDEFIYGYVGGFARWHCTRDIIRAVDKLVKAGRWHGKVLLVGITPRARSTVRLVEQFGLEEHFIQVGWVFRDRLPLYFGACDIGIGTFSRAKCKYGLSAIKVWEYLAARLPVVVAEADPYPDVVGKNGLGYIFPPEDVDALAEALAEAYDKRSGIPAMGTRARRYMVENGSWEVVSSRIWAELATGLKGN